VSGGLIAVAAFLAAILPADSRPAGTDAELSPSAVAVAVAGGGATSLARLRPGMAATTISLPLAESVAAMPDGGFLLVTACAVLRVTRGAIARAAGNGQCVFGGDGGPAAQAGLEGPEAIEATPDGGFLLRENHRVRRVTPDGVITTVAGSGSDQFGGDGGPAVQAGLQAPGDIAALPGGGFLVTDGDRVRRVDSAGIITTVAGTGESGFTGDGGPATRARLSLAGEEFDETGGLAALPNGGFLVADAGNARVRAVDAAGLIRTVAGDGRPGATGDGRAATRAHLEFPVALLTNPDGSWLIGDLNKTIRRVASDGTISTVAGKAHRAVTLLGHGIGIFNGEGLTPRHASVVPVGLARAADGTLLIATGDRNRVLAIARPESSLPAVAITRTHISRTRLTAAFTTTIAGQAHLAVTRRGATSRTVDAPVRPGRARLDVPVPSTPGVYRVTLTVRAQTTTEAAVGVLIGPLQAGTARRAVYRYADAAQEGNGHIVACHRFGPRRIDCENADDGEFCLSMNAVTVGTSGLVRFRNYNCPRHGQPLFRRHPGW
jgi:hypothetical protein